MANGTNVYEQNPFKPVHNLVWDPVGGVWVPEEQAAGGGGGGVAATEYTEDAAAPANPVGPVQSLVRKDTPAASVTADGDIVTQRGTNYGAAYVTLLDTAGAEVVFGGGGDASAANQLTEITEVQKLTAQQLDYDTSGASDPTIIFGIALPSASGAVAGGTSTNPIQVGDAGGSITVDGTVGVSGTVAVTQSGTWDEVGINDSGNSITVDDGAGSLTVDNNGTFATQATLQTGNNVVGQVKLTDGTDVADVLDLTNSNPLTVAIVDTNGDQITSFGGGTQYTEDAAAAADPVGSMLIVRRKDTLSGTEVSADGDNIAVNATAKGEIYVKHVDSIPVTDNAGSLTVDGTVATSNFPSTVDTNSGNKSASTIRVVLATDQPALTNKLLTTPDLPAGASTAAKQPALGTAGTASTDVITVQGIASMTPLQIADNGGNLSIDDGGNSITVDGTVSLGAGTALVGSVGGKPTYAAKATITWTGTSLANGSARESTVVDNTTNRYRDARIRFQTKGQASGTAYVDVYVYTALGDTTYTDGATGTDAAFTAANRFNSRYLGSIKCNANTSAVQAEFQLSDVFSTCPDKWGLIVINNSGAALSATGGDHVVEYEGIN